MARHANILSFDEVRAEQPVSARVHSQHGYHNSDESLRSAPFSAEHGFANAAHTKRVSQQFVPSAEQGLPAQQRAAEQARYQNGAHSANQSVRARSERPRQQGSSRSAVWSSPTGRGVVSKRTVPASQGGPAASASVSPAASGKSAAYRQTQASNRPAASRSSACSSAHGSTKSARPEGALAQKRKQYRKAKAQRSFDKTIGAADQTQAQQQAQPALFEMRMGASHRKSVNMQNEAEGKKPAFTLTAVWGRLSVHPVVVLIVVAVVCLFAVLYTPFANYYTQVRNVQQLEAQYEALEASNASIQAKIDYLATDEGLEDYARSELGWVYSDEQVVTVEGLSSTDSDSSDESTVIFESSVASVEAPDTWYSGILDVIFRYD